MNITITKQQWTIIGVILALVAIWYFFLRKKKAEAGYWAMKKGNGDSGYGPMGGMIQYFGNETGYEGTPGSGHGLNAMESGYRASALRASGCPCKDGTYADHCCDVGIAESGYRMTGRGSVVGNCCDPHCNCREINGSCAHCSPSAARVAPRTKVDPGRVSGIASTGIAGTSKKGVGIAGEGTGLVAGAAASDCMTVCQSHGFGYAPCKARCSGGASTSM